MNQPKGSTGPCREHLIAYLAALATGIILVALGVSPTAVITVALGMAVLYEKFGTTPHRGARREGGTTEQVTTVTTDEVESAGGPRQRDDAEREGFPSEKDI
ncbi:hypothetical protein AR457_38665 [Streptomyces agglomeratus]|nr:hypothetical protein AR457_38665 [Streptomyces agglomeratus]